MYAPAIQWNDSAIDRGKGSASEFNGGVSLITLVLGLYECERHLPMSDRYVAYGILMFCNHSDAV